LAWVQNDLDGAFAQAKSGNKMVLVNFTGYACTNCHWMKANMFTKPEVGGIMKNMVLVDLYTDGTDAVSLANQKLEEENSRPSRFLLRPLRGTETSWDFPRLTRKPEEYVSFLNTRRPSARRLSPWLVVRVGLFKDRGRSGARHQCLERKGRRSELLATWCIPCRQEIPEFQQNAKRTGARGSGSGRHLDG